MTLSMITPHANKQSESWILQTVDVGGKLIDEAIAGLSVTPVKNILHLTLTLTLTLTLIGGHAREEYLTRYNDAL